MKKNKKILRLPKKINKGSFIKSLCIALLLNFITNFLLQANHIVLIITTISVCVMVPFFVENHNLAEHYKQRFFDLSQYMENMLITFCRRQARIRSSLEDVRNLFTPDNHMYQCISNTIYYIDQGSFSKELYQEAFAYIEKDYDNRRLHLVHKFFIQVTYDGGDYASTADLLLADKKLWYDSTMDLMQQKKKRFLTTSGFIAAIVLLCAFLDLMLCNTISLPSDITIVQLPAYQIITAIFIILIQFVIKQSFHSLSMDWIAKDSIGHKNFSEEQLEKRYDFAQEYTKDSLPYFRKNLIKASPFLIASIIVFVIFHKWYLSLPLGIIFICILFKDQFIFQIVNKTLHKEVTYALSQWYLQLALLLKNNNAQVSIEKSLEDAPTLLKREIRLLIDRINDNPNDISAYTAFLSYFHDPSIISAMQMLASMTNAGNDQAAYQLTQLVDSAFLMQHEADILTNKNIMGRMKSLQDIPDVLVSLKLLVDLLLFMFVIFQSYLNF